MKKLTSIALILFLGVFFAGGIAKVITGASDDYIEGNEQNYVAGLQYQQPTSKYSKDSVIKPPIIDWKNLYSSARGALRQGQSSNIRLFTPQEVAKHNTKKDCYLIINGNVYNVSQYINYHPGGVRAIADRCGREVTGIFSSIHSNFAWDLLRKYKVGKVFNTNNTIPMDVLLNAIYKGLQQANPSANVLKVLPKNNYFVAKLLLNNKLYEIHVDTKGNIIRIEKTGLESNWKHWAADADDKR